MYADQVAELGCMLGFDFAFADRFRRALSTGRRAQRIAMEREMKKARQLRRWTDEFVERELGRWLAVNPGADSAAGFRAGWARLARFVRPKLREWEARWWRMARENDRLRARLGAALREVSRLPERG